MNMTPKIEFKKLREFGEVINDIFLFLKENFRPLLKVFIYLCGVFLLTGIIATVMQQLHMQSVPKIEGNPLAVSNFMDVFNWNYFLVIFISMLSYTAITVSTLSFIALYIQKGKEAPTPEEVWAYFKYYYLRAFYSSIVVGLLLSVGFMLCLFPGIYLFPIMSIFFPIMIMENGDISYTFGRAFKLMKDQWFTTAGVVLVIWVIAYACMAFASVPGVVLSMIGTFLPGLKAWNTVFIVIGAILQQISYVFMVIPVIGVTFCYFNLVEIQESSGLIDRINHFGEENKDNSDLGEY